MSTMLKEMYDIQKRMVYSEGYGDVLGNIIIKHPNPVGWVGYTYHGVKYMMEDVVMSSEALLAMVLPMFPGVHFTFNAHMNIVGVRCARGVIEVDHEHEYGLQCALMAAFIVEWHETL